MTHSEQTALAVELSSIEPTWRIALRVWWSWQWRTFLASFLLTLFVNFWLGALGGAVGMRNRGLMISTQVSNWIVGGAVGLYFFKDILDREFRDFRVCVIPKDAPPA